MTTKDSIIYNLFNNKELSNEEILFICRNLNDKNQSFVPYDHEQKDQFSACGIPQDEVDKMNKIFSDIVKREGMHKMSELVEKIEPFVSGNQIFIRTLIIQSIKFANSKSVVGSLDSLLEFLTGGKKKDDEDNKKEED